MAKRLVGRTVKRTCLRLAVVAAGLALPAMAGAVTTCVPKSAGSRGGVDGGPLFDSTSKR